MLREVGSIESIIEDAKKSAMKYWDCDEQKCCFECPSREVHVECTKAQRIDLVKRTRAMFKRQLPEGVEWPRYEDGEMVKIGDAYVKANGRAGVVTALYLRTYDGVPIWGIGKGGGKLLVKPGERVKRPEADTQEKIDADAGKGACEYFGFGEKVCEDDVRCPAFFADDCDEAMIRDLLRRQRELRGGEAR